MCLKIFNNIVFIINKNYKITYLQAEGKKLVTTSGYAIDYITSAESLIAQEEVRIKHYFDEKTQIKLKSIMNINLVQLYMDAIVEVNMIIFIKLPNTSPTI